MKVIPPIIITDAMLTSSTAIETPPAAYNAGTTYALDNTASVAGSLGLRTVYKSLQAGNLGNTPASSPAWWQSLGETYQVYSGAATYALAEISIDPTNHLVYESLVAGNIGNALTDTTKWLELGPTNKWAMFNFERNSKTTQPLQNIVVLTPGVRFDSLALLGMVGVDTVTVSVDNGAGVVYSATVTMTYRNTVGWYSYFFGTFKTNPSLIFTDIPPYSTNVITITLDGSADVYCGACVIGSSSFLGNIEYGAESDVINYSTVTRNFDGSSVLVPRRNVPKTIQTIHLIKELVNVARDIRDDLNATPAVWSGIDDSTSEYYEAVLILGVYKRFTINLAYPNYALISLELEEI